MNTNETYTLDDVEDMEVIARMHGRFDVADRLWLAVQALQRGEPADDILAAAEIVDRRHGTVPVMDVCKASVRCVSADAA